MMSAIWGVMPRRALKRAVGDIRDVLLADVRGQAESCHDPCWLERRLREEELCCGGRKESASERRGRIFREAEEEVCLLTLHRLLALRVVSYRGLSPGLSPALSFGRTDSLTRVPGLEAGDVDFLAPSEAAIEQCRERLRSKDLEMAWRDDLTVGQAFQYWVEPSRRDVDAKLLDGKKVENVDIAAKTQFFTDRYMIVLLLQNSLGQLWLAICKKNGWTPEVESTGTLAALEAWRKEWRPKLEAESGDVELPPHTKLTEMWSCWVPQPLPAAMVESAPETLADVRLLDPACGTGHFLVVAFEYLYELYLEEARHRGVALEAGQIVRRILEINLHGVDIDHRAVRIASAALLLKAWHMDRSSTPEPERLNVVASRFFLEEIPEDDPALVKLNKAMADHGLDPQRFFAGLHGIDHLGSLLQTGLLGSLLQLERKVFGAKAETRGQQLLFPPVEMDMERSLGILLERLVEEEPSLRGERLRDALRFLRIVQDGIYDLVMANPPYQGIGKMADARYVKKHYPLGKSNLYSAFLERGLQLAREGGLSAMLTPRNWMFTNSFVDLRKHVAEKCNLRAILDLGSGAFEDISGEVVSVAITTIMRGRGCPEDRQVALAPWGVPGIAKKTNKEFMDDMQEM